MSEVASTVTVVRSLLPPLALGLPVAGALATAWAGERRSRLRGLAAVVASAATFGVCLALLVQVFDRGTVTFNLNLLNLGGGFALNLGVDAMGAFFGLFSSILWMAACLHSYNYLSHEEKRTRFYVFMLLTEAATLGVFFVQDFFSLFVFFEIMGLLAFMLVVHNESAQARAAAIKYIYMTVVGGLALLGGIWLYLYFSGSTGFAPAAESAWLTGPFPVVALIFLIGGFGVKAGMVPLHVWLPDAHPAAPSPASALLSGVMIKAGAYGILRVILTFFYAPVGGEAAGGGHVAGRAVAGILASGGETVHATGGLAVNVRTLGFVVIWLGIATMVTGMLLALVQNDIKRTLAYSSVSQMGFILMGAGCLAFLGPEGTLGLAGSLYHVINHAFFKGLFFLAAGSILFRVHQLDMYKLGGLWRKMPVTCFLWCIAALGIMGITLFGGFVSKTLLHEAILEAHSIAGAEGLWSAGAIKLAEFLFIATSAGTIAYISKMTYYVFFRRTREGNRHVEEAREAPPWMLAGTAVLAVGVLVNGLFPGLLMRDLIAPVVGIFPGFEHASVAHLSELSIFTWANIKQIIIPVLAGAAIFTYGARKDLFRLERIRFDLFHVRLPRQLGVDYWYQAGARGFLALLATCARLYARFKAGFLGLIREGVAALRRIPREPLQAVKVETVYGGLARGSKAVLMASARTYARVRQETVARVKAAPGRLARAGREALPEDFSRLGRDISLGPLMVTLVLLVFLIVKLL